MSFMFLPKINPRQPQDRQAAIERELIAREAKIGGKLFGPLPKGHERQFFCLDEHTWIWHESWTDNSGHHRTMTTRYDIRPSGILKVQDGGNGYQRLSRTEVQNFRKATRLYQQRVRADYQHMAQQTA